VLNLPNDPRLAPGVQLTGRQASVISSRLRAGALDSLRIANAIDPAGKTHHTIEVKDMGQFAKDWTALKGIIKQKDDAIDQLSKQVADQGTQITTLTQQVAVAQQQAGALQEQLDSMPIEDADDIAAVAEIDQVVKDNIPSTSSGQAAPAVVDPAAVTTFTK
jgi:septal ring factor EnvC (AmiA/AmiB activator)